MVYCLKYNNETYCVCCNFYLQEQIKEEHRNVAIKAAFMIQDLQAPGGPVKALCVPLKACRFVRAVKQKPFQFTASTGLKI